MITITKERLLTIKQWRETYGPGSNVVLPAEEAEELARIALAALEAEPIGFRCRRNDNLGDWSYVYHREPDDFERKHLVIEGIYAAPPAPVVPEEKPMPNPLSMYAVDAVAAIAGVRGWNAVRGPRFVPGTFGKNKIGYHKISGKPGKLNQTFGKFPRGGVHTTEWSRIL
ncbi:hypothetical protein ACISSW_25145, partial [Escherichia coli]